MIDEAIDCKHELTAQYLESKKTIMFGCLECNIPYSNDNIIILTKAHKQQMDAVIEAGKKYSIANDEYVKSFDLEEEDWPELSVVSGAMKEFFESLKALGGE